LGKYTLSPFYLLYNKLPPLNILPQTLFWDVQIVFQPTAVFLLTGIPANKLTNQFFDATNIFSKNIKSNFAQLQ